jgi:3-hydroxybutyryl-CoA dehydratase
MPSIKQFSFSDISVGMTAEFTVSITESLVESFCTLSGDSNPLHMDEDYAKTTPFGGRIAHGQISACLFSRLIGMHLPGKYALYLSQTSQFRSPLRIGMETLVRGTVLQVSPATHTIVIQTQVINIEDNSLLTDGQALVKVTQ